MRTGKVGVLLVVRVICFVYGTTNHILSFSFRTNISDFPPYIIETGTVS